MARSLSAAASRQLRLIEIELEMRRRRRELLAYRDDPNGFIRNRLGMSLWHKQEEVIDALFTHGRVMVESCNSAGKTAVLGASVATFHDLYDPGICIVTSPRAEQIETVTFKEVRKHLGNRPGMAPRAPQLMDSPDHFIRGTTATNPTAFQGHHCESMYIVFEEAIEIEPDFWTAARGMLKGGDTANLWLVILNPTDTDSHAYHERSALNPDGTPYWKIIRISALEHPNIWANLQGEPDVINGAVNLAGIVADMTMDESWGTWVPEDQFDPEKHVDLWDATNYGKPSPIMPNRVIEGAMTAFPNRYWAPGPEGESRILGRYPSQALYSVFSEQMFTEAANRPMFPTDVDMPEIGCDVARYGDDRTVVFVQRAGKFLHSEARAKQGTDTTAIWLRELADRFAKPLGMDPRKVPIRIDDTGVGGGVTDQNQGYLFIPVIAQARAMNEFRYPDKRSEILFSLAERLKTDIDLKDMPVNVRSEVVKQATKVGWKPDSKGKRRVLSKQLVKDKLGGKSPDELDAMGLAFYRYGSATTVKRESTQRESTPIHHRETGAGSRRLYGG
jgi:hypothetical protein